MLYWSIGRDVIAEQRAGGWGKDVVGRIAEDLRLATGSARGFSRRNLFCMRRFSDNQGAIAPLPEIAARKRWHP